MSRKERPGSIMRSTAINKVEKLEDGLYAITETESIHCYLIVGTEKAVIFDIGYGYEDIMPIVRELTNLPVMLVLSHGDPDHALGTSHFQEVGVHELDWGKLFWNDTEDMRRMAVEYRLNKMPELVAYIDKETFISTRISPEMKHVFLREGDILSLGGRTLQVLHTPGHSYGHIMLWDKERKQLFSGDQITQHNIWYFAASDEQAPFEVALESLKGILDKREYIDKIYPAHGKIPIDIRYVEDQIECLEKELPGNFQNDKPFHSFKGEGYQHFYKTVNLIYSDERLSRFIGKKITRGED